MSLDLAGFAVAIEDLSAAPEATRALCAQQWADSMETYASDVVPPSTTVSTAAEALKTALQSAFAQAAAAPAMETAFAAFGAAVGAGMLPAFVATPPSAPVGFAALFALEAPATHEIAATRTTALIHLWMTSGASVPAGGGTVIVWS